MSNGFCFDFLNKYMQVFMVLSIEEIEILKNI